MNTALLALILAAPETLRLDAPVTGWTFEPETQVVVTHARPDIPVTLNWLGIAWQLWPNEIGRAGVYLPLVGSRNLFEVEQPERGSAVAQLVEAGQLPELAIVVAWEPGARLDLRVTDPAGEVCDSNNRITASGGVRLRDDPEAPGPHVFESLRGKPGEYRISLVCGRLPKRAVRVRGVAILLPGTTSEERREFTKVVARCDEVAELGVVQLIGSGSR